MWSSNRMRYYHRLLTGLTKILGFSMDTPWKDLDQSVQEKILYGTGNERITVEYVNRFGRKRKWDATFEGAVPFLNRRHESAESDAAREYYQEYMAEVPCDVCNGGRLNPISLAVTIEDRNIAEVSDLSLGGAYEFFDNLELSERDAHIAERVLKEVRGQDQVPPRRGSRLPQPLPLGGDPRRRRGTADPAGHPDRVGAGRSPLHPRRAIHRVPPAGQPAADRDSAPAPRPGNTLIVVEHDEETIRVADHIVDIGPGAGEHGGYVVVEGDLATCASRRVRLTDRRLPGGTSSDRGAAHPPAGDRCRHLGAGRHVRTTSRVSTSSSPSECSRR